LGIGGWRELVTSTTHQAPITPIPNPQSPTPSATPSATLAAAFFVAVSVALTWPLAAGLTHRIPGDFGDPLFTSWVIAWDATHLGRGWWNANIFAPHPLALAYSEHFLPQALQALPIYAATKNPILCYNLLFLSTFVLSALGMFLFARELTGSSEAALVSGLAFAFSPYRIASIPHLQVLSAAWMPFVLYGLRRYVVTRRVRPLAGAAAAWIVQNLSCGYYLLFFSPIVVAYAAWELMRAGLWRDRRAMVQVAVAGLVVAVVTVPFLLPYIELRRLGFSPRSLDETRRFSADVYGYLTADPNLRLWGPLAQAWPHAEGVLFPGLTIVALAIVGAVGSSAPAPEAGEPRPGSAEGRRYRKATTILAIAWLAIAIALLFDYSIRLPGIKITSLGRALVAGAIGAGALAAVSRRTRATTMAWLRTPAAFFTLTTLFAVAMSFGPDVHAKGRSVADSNIYALFYSYVPGFDGLRVPARYAMIATLALAVLAALGVAAIDARYRRRAAAIAGALIVVEAFAVPIPIDQHSTSYSRANLAPLPPTLALGANDPAVYRYVAQLPESATILELPLGEPAFDIRYMFYSTGHWRRLVNGYSGGAPESYGFLTEAVNDALSRPDRAWDAVSRSGATHLVVHEGFFREDFGRRLSAWARAHGAREVAAFGDDRVFSTGVPP
jgi:Bacterial membrane protein YfhO